MLTPLIPLMPLALDIVEGAMVDGLDGRTPSAAFQREER